METQNLFRMYFDRNINDLDIGVTHADMEQFMKYHISPVFSGFTVYESFRYWEGKREDCFIIEMIGESHSLTETYIRSICKAYKRRFDQESVLVTRQPVDMEIV